VELQEISGDAALLAGTFVVGLAGLRAAASLSGDALLWDGLVGRRAAPVVALGVVTALLSAWPCCDVAFDWQGRRQLGRYRFYCSAGAGAVSYLIYPDVTLSAAAAPEATLRFLLYAIPIGMALLLPSLWFLFRIFKAKAYDSHVGDGTRGN